MRRADDKATRGPTRRAFLLGAGAAGLGVVGVFLGRNLWVTGLGRAAHAAPSGSGLLACARCGGRMRMIATIEDPQVIRKILAHLGLPTEVPRPRPPPARAADLFADLPA